MLKTLLKYGIIFLAIHFLLVLSFRFYLKHFSVTQKSKRMMEVPASTDFLILGNSHSIRGLDSSRLKNSILIADLGECSEGMYYKIKKIVHEKKVFFKYLVLGFNFPDYSPILSESKIYKTPFYYSQIDHSEYLPDKIIAYNRLKSKYLYLLFPYKEFGMELEKKREAKRKYMKSYTFITESKKQKVETFFFSGLKGGDIPTNENTLQYKFQRKIVELCRTNNIPIIAVSYPQHSIFNAIMKVQKDNYFVKEHTKLISQLKDLRIPYLDHSVFMEQYNDQIFSDFQHLNCVGQHFFTPVLVHELDSIAKLSEKGKGPKQEILQ